LKDTVSIYNKVFGSYGITVLWLKQQSILTEGGQSFNKQLAQNNSEQSEIIRYVACLIIAYDLVTVYVHFTVHFKGAFM